MNKIIERILRVFLLGVIISMMLMTTALGARAEKSINVMFNFVNITVNSEKVSTDNLLYEGTTYVPLRAISEMLGKEVGWDGSTNTASINDTVTKINVAKKGNSEDLKQQTKKTIKVIYNSLNIVVNGEKVSTDNLLYEGTTYVPLRAISEMLDKEVGWDQDTNTASINDKKTIETQKVSTQNNFKNMEWEITTNEVKNNEKSKIIFEDKYMLVYNDKYLNKNTDIIYRFNDDGKLYLIATIVKEDQPNKNMYIDEYNYLKNELISIYNNPNQEEVYWHDELYKGDHKNIGLAISLKHLEYYSVWDLVDTKLTLRLMGEGNGKILLGTLYESTNTQLSNTSNNKEDKNPKINITNASELQQYLQENFGDLDTIIGTTKFTFSIMENERSNVAYDYWITVNYDSSFFEFAQNSIKYTDKQKEQLKKELRDHMQNIGEVAIDTIPDKKMEGSYFASWYTYPNLKIDMNIRKYYSWKNFNDSHLEFLDKNAYKKTEPSKFMWDEKYDDKL